jgi:hypothetical protein
MVNKSLSTLASGIDADARRYGNFRCREGAAFQIGRQGLVEVRFGALNGLKKGIPPCPLRAATTTEGSRLTQDEFHGRNYVFRGVAVRCC